MFHSIVDSIPTHGFYYRQFVTNRPFYRMPSETDVSFRFRIFRGVQAYRFFIMVRNRIWDIRRIHIIVRRIAVPFSIYLFVENPIPDIMPILIKKSPITPNPSILDIRFTRSRGQSFIV